MRAGWVWGESRVGLRGAVGGMVVQVRGRTTWSRFSERKATARSCAVWKSMRKALRLHEASDSCGEELA